MSHSRGNDIYPSPKNGHGQGFLSNSRKVICSRKDGNIQAETTVVFPPSGMLELSDSEIMR